jgi:hypothetical protein
VIGILKPRAVRRGSRGDEASPNAQFTSALGWSRSAS